MSRGTARLALPLVPLLLAALSGCGAPAEGTAHEIAAEDVPYRLLEESEGPPPTPVPSGQVTVPRVYLVDAQDRLVPRPIQVQAAGLGPVVSAVVDAVAEGPSEEARSEGLASAFGPDVRLRLVRVADRVATVDVEDPSVAPAADRLPIAVGQLVLSVTSVEGVDEVLLVHGGELLEAPLPGGLQTSAPLSADDYASLLAAGADPTDKAEPAP